MHESVTVVCTCMHVRTWRSKEFKKASIAFSLFPNAQRYEQHTHTHTHTRRRTHIHTQTQHRHTHTINRLTPRDAYLCQICVYRYRRILPDPLKIKGYSRLRLHLILLNPPFLLPNIPLLPHLVDFGQFYCR